MLSLCINKELQITYKGCFSRVIFGWISICASGSGEYFQMPSIWYNYFCSNFVVSKIPYLDPNAIVFGRKLFFKPHVYLILQIRYYLPLAGVWSFIWKIIWNILPGMICAKSGSLSCLWIVDDFTSSDSINSPLNDSLRNNDNKYRWLWQLPLGFSFSS